jgi:hypothetical protein
MTAYELYVVDYLIMHTAGTTLGVMQDEIYARQKNVTQRDRCDHRQKRDTKLNRLRLTVSTSV